ncbi:MAG: hypothetical protein AB7R55_24225 [Gemmatimonadales bacterium]
MADEYHLAGDRVRGDQLSLGLVVKLDPPSAVSELTPGDRFLLEDASLEGRLEACGSGSATVLLWREGASRPERTTWALSTSVRRLRG